MKVIAVNGSPRKKWNTATLLEKALEGAAHDKIKYEKRRVEWLTALLILFAILLSGCNSSVMAWHIGDVIHMGWLAIILFVVLVFVIWHLLKHIMMYFFGKEK